MSLRIKKESLIANRHLVAGTRLEDILGDTSIYTVDLQTATMDVNHIRKARYSVQLSAVPIYLCLKKVQKRSNSVLLLWSLAEERSSSSSMFKYWMLIMKFQINCLVFTRSIREYIFKPFDKKVKSLLFLVKSFFIFDQENHARWLSKTFKICWVSPSHALNSIENLKVVILWSRFQVVSFHEFIMIKLKARQLSMDWVVQAISYRTGRRSQDPKLR